jgi:hypothetical protein
MRIENATSHGGCGRAAVMPPLVEKAFTFSTAYSPK